ncbi:hypothetical protein HYS47_04080 [Candidatus Woesearchaeota archaeon]|nr:hypothetical protein [Candidatus Woesearchaeota archaeon]
MDIHRKILLVFLTISLFFIAACQQQAPSSFPDEPAPPGEQQQNIAGEAFAYGAVIPELYGLPYDTYGLYAANRQVLVSRAPGAAPGQEAFFFMVNEPYQTFPVGDTITLKATAAMPGGLVFNRGYIYKRDADGTIRWVPFAYTPDGVRGGTVRQFVNEEGNLQDSNWISGAAKVETSLAVADLTVGENYVVAYTCLKASPIEPWKCGCNEAREPECARWSLQKFMICEAGEMVNGNGQCVTVPDCPVQQEMTVTPEQTTNIQTIFSDARIASLDVEEQCEPDALDPLYTQCTDGQETAVFFKCAVEEFPAQADAVKAELGAALPAGLIEEPPVTSACAETFMNNDNTAAPTIQSECVPKDGDATSAVRGTCDGATAVSYGCVDDNNACTREVRYDCATSGKECSNGVCVSSGGTGSGDMTLTSSDFVEGGAMPIISGETLARSFCDRALDGATNTNPQLELHNVPTGTRSIVINFEEAHDSPFFGEGYDPDRSNQPFSPGNKWLLYNIDPSLSTIQSMTHTDSGLTNQIVYNQRLFSDMATQKNDYNGPCPLPGNPHIYEFKAYATSIASAEDALSEAYPEETNPLDVLVRLPTLLEDGDNTLAEATLRGTYFIPCSATVACVLPGESCELATGRCIPSSSGTTMTLTSSAFTEGNALPESAGDDSADYAARCPAHLASAQNKNPPLSIRNVPAGTQSLVLVVTDETADGLPHWVVYDISPSTTEIPEDVHDTITSSISGATEWPYYGPCPPVNDPQHVYQFTLLALSERSEYSLAPAKSIADAIEVGITGRMYGTSSLETELNDVLLDTATLRGTYQIT